MTRKSDPKSEPRVRALVLVVWEDTRDDGPRTFSVAQGLVDVEHVELVEGTHEPESNSGMAKAKLCRLVDELELVT
jgi:hypothetical protein